jgi:hypothetical protein
MANCRGVCLVVEIKIGSHIVVIDAFVLDLGGGYIVLELNGWRPQVELLWIEGRIQ